MESVGKEKETQSEPTPNSLNSNFCGINNAVNSIDFQYSN